MSIGIVSGISQDNHFSHIHASPTFLNPAMVGLINEDLRMIANYKSQWQTFDKGFQTLVASGDMKAFRGVGLQDDIGVGLQIISDKAGDLSYQTMDVSLTFSYLKALNREGDHILSAGIRTGLIQNRFDPSKLKLFEQDPAINGESFSSNISYMDISAGVGYFIPLSRRNSMYVGVGAFHLNRAFVSFIKEYENLDESLYLFPRIVLHGGANLRINEFLTIKPSAIFVDQGPHREFNAGSFFRISKEVKSYLRPLWAIYAGAWVRWSAGSDGFHKDAIIAAIRYDWKNTVVSLSFDVNISDLAKVSNSLGGPELSLIQYLDFDRPERRRSKVKCPAF